MAFAALGVIWGLPYFFIKLAIQEMSPFVVAWSRLLLAAVILLPIAWQRGALRSLGTHLVPICAFAVVGVVIHFSAISLASSGSALP
jgi:drug/metabolite transporter (DMT)-like permease